MSILPCYNKYSNHTCVDNQAKITSFLSKVTVETKTIYKQFNPTMYGQYHELNFTATRITKQLLQAER